MKFLFRWAFRFFILLVVLLVAGILLLDTIVRAIAESHIHNETGMDVKIGSLYIGLWSPVITLENLKLYNTAEFGGSPFVDMPELHVEYDRSALFSHRLHCKLVRLNLAELNVVQSKNGRTNLQALKDRERRSTRSGLKFAGIETLNLTLGKATRLDMRHPEQASEVTLNFRNQIVPDIKTEQDLETRVGALLLGRGGVPLLNLFANATAPQPTGQPLLREPARQPQPQSR
jgi:uncharacterized protein involved in outer membrane biogenesis